MSEFAEASASAAAPRAEFGLALARRVEPRQRLVRRVVGRAAGDVLRRSVRFAGDLALSSTSRWARSTVIGADVDHLAVRPPIDYWPWSDDGSVLTASAAAAPAPPAADNPFHGNDRLATVARLAGLDVDRYTGAPARPPTPTRVRRSVGAGRGRTPRRGLPIVAARRGQTAAGRGTQPGGIVASLRATLDASPPAPGAAVRRPSGVSPLTAGSTPATHTAADRRSASKPSGRLPSELPADLVALRSALTASGKINPPGAPSARAAGATGVDTRGAGSAAGPGSVGVGGPGRRVEPGGGARPGPDAGPGARAEHGGGADVAGSARPLASAGPGAAAHSAGSIGLARPDGSVGATDRSPPAVTASSGETAAATASTSNWAGSVPETDTIPAQNDIGPADPSSATATTRPVTANWAGSVPDREVLRAPQDRPIVRRAPTDSIDVRAHPTDHPTPAPRAPGNWAGSVPETDSIPTQIQRSAAARTGTTADPSTSVRPPAPATPSSNPPTATDLAPSNNWAGSVPQTETNPTQIHRSPADRTGTTADTATIPTQPISDPTSTRTSTPTTADPSTSVRPPAPATPSSNPPTTTGLPPSSNWAGSVPQTGTTRSQHAPTRDVGVSGAERDLAGPADAPHPSVRPPVAAPSGAGGSPSMPRGSTTPVRRAFDAGQPAGASSAGAPGVPPITTRQAVALAATAAARAAAAAVRPPAAGVGLPPEAWAGLGGVNRAGSVPGSGTDPAQPAWQVHGRRWRWRLGDGRHGAVEADRPELVSEAAVRPPVAVSRMGDPVTAPVAEITDLARRRADRPARALGHPAGSAIGRDVDATVRRLPTATAPAGTHEVTVRPPLAPSPGRVESRTAADSSPAPAPTGSAVGLALAAIRPPAGPGPVGAVARGLGTTSTPAETFATELARHRVERPRPLPVTFRPLATAIVGERQVHVSSGTASRKALAKVGKRAATTGDTIHLATPRPTTEVLAHELTHVAHPSPVPRFFDDDDRGPEERQAEQVAAVIRRAPILLRPAAATATTIQRRADPPRPEPGTVSAAALAAQLTASPASGDVIQRQIGAHRRRGQTAPPVLTAAPAMPVDTPSTPPIAQPAVTTDEEPGASGFPDLSTQFDRILELLEERVLRELERRGGRFRGGF